MNDGALRDIAKRFAKDIVFTVKEIRASNHENILTNQLLKSGTSIGANAHEAHYAQSMSDFISKMEIALKECYESEYWLSLLFETEYLTEEKFNKLNSECGRIRRMLISSIKTSKNNNL